MPPLGRLLVRISQRGGGLAQQVPQARRAGMGAPRKSGRTRNGSATATCLCDAHSFASHSWRVTWFFRDKTPMAPCIVLPCCLRMVGVTSFPLQNAGLAAEG